MDNHIYKFMELENGDILLKKIDNIFTNFNLITQNNDNILYKKKEKININSIQDVKKFDYKKSNITFCSLNNDEIEKLKYKNVLLHIYDLIGNGTKIIKNTQLNVQTIKKTSEGFYYIDNLGISVQGADSNKSILEIISQCIENEIEIQIDITLHNGTELCITA